LSKRLFQQSLNVSPKADIWFFVVICQASYDSGKDKSALNPISRIAELLIASARPASF
jgi:hypothetical protein